MVGCLTLTEEAKDYLRGKGRDILMDDDNSGDSIVKIMANIKDMKQKMGGIWGLFTSESKNIRVFDELENDKLHEFIMSACGHSNSVEDVSDRIVRIFSGIARQVVNVLIDCNISEDEAYEICKEEGYCASEGTAYNGALSFTSEMKEFLYKFKEENSAALKAHRSKEIESGEKSPATLIPLRRDFLRSLGFLDLISQAENSGVKLHNEIENGTPISARSLELTTYLDEIGLILFND